MVSARSTKKEILDELDTVKSLVEKKDKELSDLKKKNGQSSASRLREVRTLELNTKASEAHPDRIRQNINERLMEVERDFKIANEGLVAVQEMITIAEDRLKAVHGIDAGATELDTIIAAQREFEAKIEEKNKALQHDLDMKKKALDEDYSQQFNALENKYKRASEEAEYNHKRLLERQKDEAEQAEIITKRQLEDFKTQCETMLKKRESDLDAKQEEFDKYKAKAESFDAEIEKAVEQAVKKAKESHDKSEFFKINALESKHLSETTVLAAQVKTLTERNEELQVIVDQQGQKLTEAYERNTELASDAIKASSNQKVVVNTENVRNK